MSGLTRDRTTEHVSRDQALKHEQEQGEVHFPCSADHGLDWQPYPVGPCSAESAGHTYIHIQPDIPFITTFYQTIHLLGL